MTTDAAPPVVDVAPTAPAVPAPVVDVARQREDIILIAALYQAWGQ